MELSHDGDLLAIIKMLNSFGKHNALVCAYTELFGITPLKTKTKKWRLLLDEMKRLFDSESFSYQKKTYEISQTGIAEALGIVVHHNFPDGLESHNYLKKIMIGIAEREAQAAGRSAEKDLRKRESALMSGSRDGKSLTSDVNDSAYPVPEESVEPPPVRLKSMPEAHLTDEQREANRRRLKALMKGIGGEK